MANTPIETHSILRQRAEEKSRFDETTLLKTLALEDAQELFHELRVHQIELEMQNEELRQAQHDLEVSRARYFNLYDLAPVGYLTLSERGLIQEANLAAATMLGEVRKNLLKKPISQFVLPEDQDLYYLNHKKLLDSNEVQSWETHMLRSDKSAFWARLQATPPQDGEYWLTLVDISQRKRAEEELRKRNELFSLFIKHSPIYAYIKEVTATESHVLLASDNFQQMVGLPSSKLVGKTTSELFPPEFADKIDADDRVVVSVGDVIQREENFNGRNYTSIKFPIVQGDKTLLAGYTIDITERRQAEMVLQSRVRISQYALDHSLDELLTKVIDEAEGLTGSQIGFFHFVDDDQVNLSLQTWSSNTLATICATQGQRQHYPLEQAGVWADCIREKKPLIHNDYESLPQRKGLPPGHAPVQRELVVPIFRNNLVVAVLGVGNKKTNYITEEMAVLKHLANLAWDIVTRKRAEESLRESENRFRSIMDMAPNIAVQGYNLEGVTTYWNHASESIYGYTCEEALGKNLLELIIPPEMREYVSKAMAWMTESGEPIPAGELLLMRKDGSRLPVFSSHALLKPPGRDMELFCMDLDMTMLKQTEQELQQAKEVAEAASHAKSDFLATMSHEIRTPLSAMLGNIELLEGSPLTPPQQEYLKDCKSASQMLLQVINDVLDFSKIEAGKLVLVEETFSIPSMSGQLVRMFSAVAGQKGLELTITLADDLPEYISCDQQRVRQIIANLLSNAIKFTHQGAVSLDISRQQPGAATETDMVLLQIVVRDTGIGIPEEKLAHVFESFTQVESFTTRTAAGTGLGLPICRRLLTLMGGSISVVSVPGKGSVFTAVLPVTCVKVEVEAQAQAQAQAQIPARRILLADDDERGRTVAQKLLQRRGYMVTAVENGAGILDALQKENYEILLTDISMPDMEGTQVARIIRTGKQAGINPHIPIIAMTAHAFSEDRARFIAAGINGYVSKPVNLEELFRQIEALCEGASQ